METITVKSRFLQHIDLGNLAARYSADGSRVLRYYVDLRHSVLNVHKELSAPELFLLQHKVDALVAQWDLKTIEHERHSLVHAGKGAAEDMTIEAGEKLDALTGILKKTLSINDRVNWDGLKDFKKYDGVTEYIRSMPRRDPRPEPQFIPTDISFWDKLFGKAERKAEAAQQAFAARRSEWAKSEAESINALRLRVAEWTAEKAAFESEAARKKQEFLNEQAEANAKVDALAAGVAGGEAQAVVEHASMVLEASRYEGLFEKQVDLEYSKSTKILMIEFRLPSPDEMPTIKSVRFIPATGEMRETHISEREQKSNYDSVCYQICLRTLHELFEADEHDNLESILFNGFATFVDRATGNDVSSLIMSVLVRREDFLAIALSRVDPKSCFKSLKGVSASSLAALAPVAPVLSLNKHDRRFIDPRNASDSVDDSTNLAAMDWEDFEHPVREVFQKEFAARGGEVKITQSSSDGGVDAVAFDPDPITGGKIVIQAKRYTRTVGVAAVRDLYGTMQHEAASRGILVTTADYGPDAHQFVTGKHITLMTGANLLYLLAKHGISAKIDVRQARKDLNLREYR